MLTLDHLNTRRTSLLGARRRDSGISLQSGFSNLSKYSHLSQGQICITLQVDSMRYLKSSDEYDIKFSSASIISLDILKKQIRCKVKASKIKQIQEELDDDDITSMLDDISYDGNKTDANSVTNDKAIEREWNEIAPKRREKNREMAYGSCSIGDCDFIERISFIQRYYSIFIKFKSVKNESTDSIYSSMTKFISKLKGYNRNKLLSDYFHVKKYHMNNDTDKELLQYIKTKVPNCNHPEMCPCLTRNDGKKQIYRALSNKGRRDLYWISDETKDGSPEEMSEIALIEYLDIIHGLFIHSGLISDGKKFITEVEADSSNIFALSSLPRIAFKPSLTTTTNKSANKGSDSKETVEDGNIETDDADTIDDTQSEISTVFGTGSEYKGIVKRNTPMLKSSFGQSFDYWKSSHPYYCPATYEDLRSELLGNNIHSMSSDDYELLVIKANDYLRSDIGKNLQCKREFRWMKKSIKYGERISINHIIAVLICTNYYEIINDFRNIGCRKLDNNETMSDVKRRHCEIANFLRYLKESIWCFGDVLSEKQRVYHGLNTKLSFPKCCVSFDRPSSLTTKYVVAQKIDNQTTNIVLKLGKVLGNEQNMVYLDTSNFSYFPAEKERIIFGGSLGFIDIVYNGSSHSDSVLSLTLYQQIISGKWYNDKNNIFFKKKYQRKIIKMLSNMVNYDSEHSVHNKYMQQLFECITKYNNEGNNNNKTVWFNKKECEKLIPDLYTLLFDKYISYLLQNNIGIKYVYSIEMNLSVSHINDSSFKKSLYSKKYKFNINPNGDKCTLHFRCYKKYDGQKEEDMFRGFIATQNKLHASISKIELKYGLSFIQLSYNKWDSCVLTNNQLYKGSSLFKMKDIQNIDVLNVKIAFQIHKIYDHNGKLIHI